VDAAPLLSRLAGALERHGLEAVLIGNSAAAVHGAPVTTLDFDFMFRTKKPSVTRKQKLLALKKDSDRAERDMIRRLLALPPERRTHFLRRLIGVGGSSCL